MKKSITIVLSMIIAMSLFSQALVASAYSYIRFDENGEYNDGYGHVYQEDDFEGKAYLGDNTYTNLIYKYKAYEDDSDSGDQYASYTIRTAYHSKKYTFIANSKGLYKVTSSINNESGYGNFSLKTDCQTIKDVKKGTYIVMNKGDSFSFSASMYDDIYNENQLESYNVDISYAESPVTVTDGNTYVINPDTQTATLTQYSKTSITSKSVEIDNVVLTFPVTKIDEYAFYNFAELQEVTVPQTVVKINNYAFTNCLKLKQVSIKNENCIIEPDAFFICRKDIKIIGGNQIKHEQTDETISINNADVVGIKNKIYTGNAVTQSLAVSVDDESLEKDVDYKVTYQNNKNVGTATVTITGINKYNGTIKNTFKIIPKSTTINKVTAQKKGFNVTWKKQTTQTSGYQIRYSTDKSFQTNKKTVDITKNTATTKAIKNLKAKKRYYLQIRTYRIVNGKVYYSSWSKMVSVTTKK